MEIAEEIAYRARKQGSIRSAGACSPADAAAAAQRAMGNSTMVREDARRVWLASWLKTVAGELRRPVDDDSRSSAPWPSRSDRWPWIRGRGVQADSMRLHSADGMPTRRRMVTLFAAVPGVVQSRFESGFSLDQVAMFERARVHSMVIAYDRTRPDGFGRSDRGAVRAGYLLTSWSVPLARGRAFTEEPRRFAAAGHRAESSLLDDGARVPSGSARPCASRACHSR
jgi:hypothetical protein